MNKNVVIAVLIALLIGNAMGFAVGKSVGEATSGSAAASSQVNQAAVSSYTSQAAAASSEDQFSNASAENQSSTSPENQPVNSLSENQSATTPSVPTNTAIASHVVEDGSYTSKDDVAAYIYKFGHLPPNYISKSKAKKAGWVAKEGNLDEVLPGMSIGGSDFYNDEGLLPDASGRTWTECDINYEGGYRGAERIVFSNDGLIFYTADHYKTFEQLY